MRVAAWFLCLSFFASALLVPRAAGQTPSFPSRLETDSTGNLVLRWPTLLGSIYRIEASTDLTNWDVLPGSVAGTGDELTAVVGPVGETVAPHRFWRVQATGLPHFRGFNLLDRFDQTYATTNRDFTEADFQMIHELGFNFVRIPLDFRTYIVGTDWHEFDPRVFANLDEVVAWGRRYGIHVQFCLHRAPGYCVNSSGLPPAFAGNLWTDPVVQAVFVAHWDYFARRYRDVPTNDLSFNLVNEPAGVSAAVYATVMNQAAAAIRQQSPERWIFADGLDYANTPVDTALLPGLQQAAHCYEPFSVTHYKASWIDHPEPWADPVWPTASIGQSLYGPSKPDLIAPLVLQGDFSNGGQVVLRVSQVSIRADVVIKADGLQIARRNIVCGDAASDPDATRINLTEWGYQNYYDLPIVATIPPGTHQISLELSDGDWLTYASLGITTNGTTLTLYPSLGWGVPPPAAIVLRDGGVFDTDGRTLFYDFPRARSYAAWGRSTGTGVMVGEWGVHNMTPHALTLAFMEDELKAFRSENLGWALWNFRGSFGILDSGRADVDYENFHGHWLDRKMLELLQRY